MTASYMLGTLAAAALFSSMFFLGRTLHLRWAVGQRTAVSAAGGMAVAYVFVDLSPDLQLAASAFLEATSHLEPRFFEMGVSLATMAGFLFFYGVEELVIRSRDEEERQLRREAKKWHPLFFIHILAFSAYAWTVSYLLIRSPGRTAAQLVFYACAMAVHFFSVAHALREEHGGLYDRLGAWVLAASCAAGWVCGMAVGLPETAAGLLLGWVAGGVIANTVISELPREKQGKFVPFLMGAVAYAGLLLLAK